MNNNSLFNLIYKKFDKCFKLLGKYVSTFVNFIEWKYQGSFDYDPINSDGFIEALCSLVGDTSLHIIYTNIDSCVVQKSIQFRISDVLSDKGNKLQNLRDNHALLYDCTIEGSYYLFGNLGEWIVFYDASSDFGVILSQENKLMISMSEYLIT